MRLVDVKTMYERVKQMKNYDPVFNDEVITFYKLLAFTHTLLILGI
jgi:hypothetical protein